MARREESESAFKSFAQKDLKCGRAKSACGDK